MPWSDALTELGVGGVRLKWPNDLVTARGKLGGILIEMRAEAGGPVHVVIGIGLNVLLDEAARAAVAATGNVADDIRAHRSAGARSQCDRRGAARAPGAGAGGFPAPRAARRTWRAGTHATRCRDREVRVENAGEMTRGVARGIDAHGALLVETPRGVQRFISGEVSVRLDQ